MSDEEYFDKIDDKNIKKQIDGELKKKDKVETLIKMIDDMSNQNTTDSLVQFDDLPFWQKPFYDEFQYMFSLVNRNEDIRKQDNQKFDFRSAQASAAKNDSASAVNDFSTAIGTYLSLTIPTLFLTLPLETIMVNTGSSHLPFGLSLPKEYWESALYNDLFFNDKFGLGNGFGILDFGDYIADIINFIPFVGKLLSETIKDSSLDINTAVAADDIFWNEFIFGAPYTDKSGHVRYFMSELSKHSIFDFSPTYYHIMNYLYWFSLIPIYNLGTAVTCAGMNLSTLAISRADVQFMDNIYVGRLHHRIPDDEDIPKNILLHINSKKYKKQELNIKIKDPYFIHSDEFLVLTFEEKLKSPYYKATRENLFGHFSQPIGNYQRKANHKFIYECRENLSSSDVKLAHLARNCIEMSQLPKDIVFLTHDLSSPEVTASFFTVGGTFNGECYILPDYIGPYHILCEIERIFGFDLVKNDNKKSVMQFYQILRQLQKNSFYNIESKINKKSTTFEDWLNDKITLSHLVYEIFQFVENIAQEHTELGGFNMTRVGDMTYNTDFSFQFPYPSWSVRHRHGGDITYTNVMFIGKYEDSVWNLPDHKKWCWFKNSDGFVYDGEYFPADMQFKHQKSKTGKRKKRPRINSEKQVITIDDEDRNITLQYYMFEWRGLMLNPKDDDFIRASKHVADYKRAQMGYYPYNSSDIYINPEVSTDERNQLMWIPFLYGGKKTQRKLKNRRKPDVLSRNSKTLKNIKRTKKRKKKMSVI